MKALRALVCTGLVVASAPASAQGMMMEFFDPQTSGQPADVAVEQEGRAPGEAPRRFRLALGAGLAAGPNFQGSDAYRVGVLPVVFAGYGRFFFGLGGLGYRLYSERTSDGGFGLALNVTPSGGRKEDADARLAGLGDVDRTLRAGLSAGYFGRNYAARGGISTDIAGQHQGTLARFDLFGRYRLGSGFAIFAGPGFTWASREYMQAFFGVSEEQSLRSAFPEFQAHSGVNTVRFSIGSIYRIDRHWRALATYSAARLNGDAAASPITETRVQNHFLLSGLYAF